MGLNIRVPRNRWRRRAGWMIRRTTNWVEQTNKMMSVFERLNGAWSRDRETPVSYTHLTLPTKA